MDWRLRYITADLLRDAESPVSQQQDVAPGHWTSLPEGVYQYEVVLYNDNDNHKAEAGRFSGVFEVGADGQVFAERDPLSDAGPTERVQRALGVILNFFIPSAHAQNGDFDDYISIRNTSGPDAGSSRLNLTAQDSITVTSDSWRLINDGSVGHRFDIVQGLDTERLTILQNGNVGIGTTSPQRSLHVTGNHIRISPTLGSDWDLNPGSSGLWLNRANPATFGVLMLQNDAPENSIVANASGVGIGTNLPNANLHVEDSTGTMLQVRNTSAAGSDQVMFRLEAQGNDKVRFMLRGSGGSNSWTFDNTPALNQFSISKVGTGLNEFTVNAAGNGVFRGTVTATSFLNSSSREFKTDIEALDAQALLEGVMALPVLQWRYRDEEEGALHIGPMAEDFQATFGLGSGQHIPLSDMGGITLAAVQEVYRELQARNETIDRLEAEVARLQRDNAELREGLASDNRALTERLAALEQRLIDREELVAQR